MKNFYQLALNLAKDNTRSKTPYLLGLLGISASTATLASPTYCEVEPIEPIEPNKPASIFLSNTSKQKLSTFLNLPQDNDLFSSIKCIQKTSPETITEIDDILDTEITLTPLAILYSLDNTPLSILVDIEHRHKHEFLHTDFPLLSLTSSNTEPVWTKLFNERSTSDRKARFFSLVPDFNTEEYKVINISAENLSLTGTLCLECDWDESKQVCEYTRENNCSFCIFMKGGPCRDVFKDWEKCVDKYEGEDFVKMCTNQTIAMNKCVHRYPDYFELSKDEE